MRALLYCLLLFVLSTSAFARRIYDVGVTAADDIYPEPKECRNETALYADPTLFRKCYPKCFLKPNDPNIHLSDFQREYFQKHGTKVGKNSMLQ